MTKECSVDGCDCGHYARGFCHAHWKRWKRFGDPGSAAIQLRGRVGCSVDECEGRHFSIGLCSKHHQRWRAHGDPTVFIGSQRAALVNGPAVHWRLRRDRGPATGYACQHCGRSADQWAYDHSEADPLMDEDGPYSLDQSRYMPLCYSCHTKFDKRSKKATGVSTGPPGSGPVP